MRKTKIVTIEAENRDKGKTFLLTEMSAAQAEKWAARAFLALAKSGAELPAGAADAGLAGVATAGLAALSGLDWDLAEPLLDEMFRCIQIQPDPIKNPRFTRALTEEDTEYSIFAVKHVFDAHVVLQFNCTNTISEQVLEQVTVATDLAEAKQKLGNGGLPALAIKAQ